MANTVNPTFRAVEIALVAIKQNRFNTWDELMNSGIDTRLTPDQLALVLSEMATVSQIQVTPKKLVTITLCPVCNRIAFVAGAIPTKCTLSFNCGGKPVKAGAVKRAVAEPELDAEEPDTEAALRVAKAVAALSLAVAEVLEQ